MNILPGEPVPPGFEDEVERVAEIQGVIDMYKGNALVGLEYTIELNDEDRTEPAYFCVLCEKRGDPRTIMQHWTSFNHRMKYLGKHYPTAMRELHPVKYKPNSNQIMVAIVQKLAEAIEEHHGRLALPVWNADEFQQQKRKVMNEISAKFHYDERNGPNFVNVIDRSLWESTPDKGAPANGKGQISIKPLKRLLNPEVKRASATRDGFDEISSDSDPGSKKLRKSERGSRQQPAIGNSSPHKAKVLPTPKELGYQSTQIAEEGYKWEKYRCTLEIALKQMTEEQKLYTKNPESHPLYPETWKKYWNRRYKEIQVEGKVDPNKYDYKPEWIVFWNDKMSELFQEDLDKKKMEIKKKVGLAEDAVEKVEQLKEKYKLPTSRKESSKAAGGGGRKLSGGADVIDISDESDDPLHRPGRRRGRRISSTSRRSQSPRRRHSGGRNPRGRSRSRSPSTEYEHYERRKRGASAMQQPPMTHHMSPSASGYGAHEHDYYPPHQIPPPGSVYTRGNRAGGHGIPRPMPPAHYHHYMMESHKYSKYARSPSPSPSNGDSSIAGEPTSLEQEGPLTVVSVLRLLAALENNLGSMGPKVVDMLGKALALEKVKANSADDLLHNEDHCVFFETIKEKLKGLLIADMIDDPQKKRTIKKAIQNIANVIHQVTTRDEKKTDGADGAGGDGKAKHMFNKPNLKDLPFDRQLVATKLAAALVMQGREDVSTEDMDRLIFLFVLMAKMSHTEERVLHMADVLVELGLAAPEPKPVAPITAALAAAIPGIVDELLEKEVSALAQEVQEEISNDRSEPPKSDNTPSSSSSVLETLTDSDLQTLLQNFKHLSSDEQNHLEAHLRKLQTTDPLRVMRLSKFINSTQQDEMDSSSNSSTAGRSKDAAKASSSARPESVSGRRIQENEPSTSAHAANGRRPPHPSNANRFAFDDDDEDDYSFEDVFKAASSNVQRFSDTSRDSRTSKTNSATPRDGGGGDKAKASPSDALKFNSAGLSESLSDTQNLIANLMGSLQQSNNNARKNNPAASSSRANSQSGSSMSAGAGGPGGHQHHALQQQQQHLQPASNLPYYQQQQQQQMPQGDPYASGMGSYGQQMQSGGDGYYNMNGYNQGGGYMGGYPVWSQEHGGGVPGVNMNPMGNMQQYPSGYGMPTQQQHALGYNMYGQQNRN